MPPPSLLITTTRTGASEAPTAASPAASWTSPRSPVTIQVGRPVAIAAPAPEERRPSIPLAPRLPGRSPAAGAAGQKASWSRIGMLEAV